MTTPDDREGSPRGAVGPHLRECSKALRKAGEIQIVLDGLGAFQLLKKQTSLKKSAREHLVASGHKNRTVEVHFDGKALEVKASTVRGSRPKAHSQVIGLIMSLSEWVPLSVLTTTLRKVDELFPEKPLSARVNFKPLL